MPVTLDIADDFAAVADNTGDVLLSRRDGTGKTIQSALRRAIATKEMAASHGRYQGGDVRFHFPAEEIEDLKPGLGLGEKLIDDDGQWTILEIGRQCFDTRIACVCRDLAISEGLDTLITIQEGIFEKSDSGAQVVRSWNTLHTNLRAKIQRIGADHAADEQRRQIKPRFKIYMEDQVIVRAHFRIVGSDDEAYRPLGFEMPDRIDQLFTVDAELW